MNPASNGSAEEVKASNKETTNKSMSSCVWKMAGAKSKVQSFFGDVLTTGVRRKRDQAAVVAIADHDDGPDRHAGIQHR